jgi:hypothetical protein
MPGATYYMLKKKQNHDNISKRVAFRVESAAHNVVKTTLSKH